MSGASSAASTVSPTSSKADAAGDGGIKAAQNVDHACRASPPVDPSPRRMRGSSQE